MHHVAVPVLVRMDVPVFVRMAMLMRMAVAAVVRVAMFGGVHRNLHRSIKSWVNVTAEFGARHFPSARAKHAGYEDLR